MLDLWKIKNATIYHDFDDVERDYWFSFKQKKFLHNIDTFYYSVKFSNDFTYDSVDRYVLRFRQFFDKKYQELEKSNFLLSSLAIDFPGCDTILNLKPFNFAGYFTICLECPDYFDIFFAPRVPHSANNGLSVTCECIVQIRSYMLWMYGTETSYDRSFAYIQAIAKYFQLDISFCQENRADFCWHSNYLGNPERFFTPERFYKMRVDRFKDALFHTSKDGMDGYEIDYIALGKRSDKVFIRIYLKSKEVVEKGYKPWFFKVWLLNGLINRYDLYVYEYAFLQHSWKKIDMGRIAFYHEFGRDSELVSRCSKILNGEITISPDSLRQFADQLTPKVNIVMNVEYQVMRRHTKTYELIPFFDNSDYMKSERIYDFLDNEKVICDYLTHNVFRLAEEHVEGKNDSNKSRRPLCAFWEALCRCRLGYECLSMQDAELVRNYSRQMSSQIVKERALKSMVTYGIYSKGINTDSPLQDCIDALCTLNDNDLQDALRFKTKKVRQFNATELADVLQTDLSAANNIILVNKDTGELYSYNTPRS